MEFALTFSMFKVLQLTLDITSFPISMVVLLPSISMASVLPVGNLDASPLLTNEVPMFTSDISIFSTGMSFKITLSVFSVTSFLNCSSSSLFGISLGAK